MLATARISAGRTSSSSASNFVCVRSVGNTISSIMSRLSQDGGDPDIRAAFEKTMSGSPDTTSGAPYTPLEMFVMDLFRTISPNGGSISSISDTRQSGSSDKYGDSDPPCVRFGLPLPARRLHYLTAYLDQLRSPPLDASAAV